MQSSFSRYAIGGYVHDLCTRVFSCRHCDAQGGNVHTCIGGALWLRMLGRPLLIRRCSCPAESEGDSSEGADAIQGFAILACAEIIRAAAQPDVARDTEVRTP